MHGLKEEKSRVVEVKLQTIFGALGIYGYPNEVHTKNHARICKPKKN